MRNCFALLSLALCSLASPSLYSSATLRTGSDGATFSTVGNDLVSYTHNFGAFDASASGQADYGTLHAFSAAISHGVAEYSYAQGYSSFGDSLTIYGGVGDDYYLVDYLVSGTISATGDARVSANLLWANLPNGVPGGLTSGTHTVAGVYAQKFTYGVAFSIGAELYTTVDFLNGTMGEGTADFSHTATLTGIHIVDKNGASVGPREIVSASGHIYPQAVPEPTSMAALGLGGLALLRRRRRA